jgi:hypothetical protein
MLSAKSVLLLPAIFRDVNNLMLEDKKIWTILTCHSYHVLVVILNPTADDFAIGQLQAHYFLLFSQRLQIGRFFKRLVRRRSALLIKRGISWL